MEISTRHDGRSMVFTLQGRLDVLSAPHLERQAMEELERGERDFILDLAGVEYLSSAGLRTFLMLAKKLQAQKGSMIICGLSGGVKEVFEVSGFVKIFNVCPTLGDAQAGRDR